MNNKILMFVNFFRVKISMDLTVFLVFKKSLSLTRIRIYFS